MHFTLIFKIVVTEKTTRPIIIAQGFTKYKCHVMHKTKLTRIEWMFSAGDLKKISLYYIVSHFTWSTKALIIRNKVNVL